VRCKLFNLSAKRCAIAVLIFWTWIDVNIIRKEIIIIVERLWL
jgi:hypothetical protein